MRSILLYLSFVFYMFGAVFKKIKLNYIRKHISEEAAQEYVFKCVSGWAKYIINFIGINVKVTGAENITHESCLFVSNHQGSMDIPLIIAYAGKPVGFIAKKEMLKLRFITSWMKEINCIFMDRSNVRESVKSINEGAETLKNGHSLVIFPEGTRSKGPQLGEFKKGSMKLATKSGVPIIPVTINGSYKVREANKHNELKSADVNITFSKPIYIDELTKEEQSDLSETIRNIINKNLVCHE